MACLCFAEDPEPDKLWEVLINLRISFLNNPYRYGWVMVMVRVMVIGVRVI